MSDETLRPDVVAGRYNRELFDESGETLLVNEIFYSIQGEGQRVGLPTVFIRLAKCNLACKFCDTEFETYQKMTLETVLTKVLNLTGHHPKGSLHVDLTGGEPLLQNCGPLIRELRALGYAVGVETSGSVWTSWCTRDYLEWITVSPKVLLSRVPAELRDHAHEFKWVVNQAFLNMLYMGKDLSSGVYVPGRPNYLQPESNAPKWIDAAVKLVQQYPDRYRLGVQLHKVIGAR